MAKKKPKKLNPFLFHEALDRTFLVECVIDTHLCKHPGIQAIPRAARLIEKAAYLLAEAYQVIGQAHGSLDGESSRKAGGKT